MLPAAGVVIVITLPAIDVFADDVAIVAPVAGVVFFMHLTPLTYGHSTVIKLII